MKINLSESRIREIIKDEMMKRNSLKEQQQPQPPAPDEIDAEALASDLDDVVLELVSSLDSDVDRVIDLLDFPTSLDDLNATRDILTGVVEQHGGLGLGVFNALYGMKESEIPLSENKNRLEEAITLAALGGGIAAAAGWIGSGLAAVGGALGAGGLVIAGALAIAPAVIKEAWSLMSGLTKNVFENMEDRGMYNAISSTKFISSMKRIQGDKLKDSMTGALDKFFQTLSSGKAPPTKDLLLSILAGGDDAELIESNDEQVKEIQKIFSISPTGLFTNTEANKVSSLLDSHWVLHAEWRAEGQPGREVSSSDIFNELVSFSQGGEPDGSLDKAAESMGVEGETYMETLAAFLKELNSKPEPEAPEPEPVIPESKKLKMSKRDLMKMINNLIITEVNSGVQIREAFDDLSGATPPAEVEIPEADAEEEEEEEEDTVSSGGGTVSTVRRIEQIINHPDPDGTWDPETNKSFYQFVKVRGEALGKDFSGIIGKQWQGPGAAAASSQMSASYAGTATGMLKFLKDIKGSGGGSRQTTPGGQTDVQVEYKAEFPTPVNAPLTEAELGLLKTVLAGPGMFDGEGTIIMKFPDRNFVLDRKVNSWEIKDPSRALSPRAKRAITPVLNSIWESRPMTATRREGGRKELRDTFVQVDVVPK